MPIICRRSFLRTAYEALNVLEIESEPHLCHLYGQHPERYVFPLGVRLFPGASLRLTISVVRLIRDLVRDIVRRGTPRVAGDSIVAFAGSGNQTQALASTTRSLQSAGVRVTFLYDGSGAKPVGQSIDHAHRVVGRITSYLAALLTLLHRLRPLLQLLREIDPRLSQWKLDRFLVPYFWICFFLDLFRDDRPALVLVSNDHNAANRSLMAVCRYLGVKVAYLQHASVSQFFPSLTFDYAFLDGEAALQTYSNIERRRREGGGVPLEPVIFLSGQKKPVSAVPHRILRSIPIQLGLALKATDPLTATYELIHQLRGLSIPLVVRWHPRQSARFKAGLTRMLGKDLTDVNFSDPHTEPLKKFFTECTCVVAGNSSIHLEAALAGRPSFYYEYWKDTVYDYYGYVSRGVSERLNSIEEIATRWYATQHIKFPNVSQAQGIRYFSATYGTAFEDREGELVARTVLQLIGGNENLFYEPYVGPSIFNSVWKIRSEVVFP